MHVFDLGFRGVEVSADHYQRFGFFALKFKDSLLKDFEGFLFFIPIIAVDIDQVYLKLIIHNLSENYFQLI